MFGPIGGSEFLLIAALALLLFGPRKLPQIGRSIGRALAEFRGATQEFRTTLEREVQLEQVRDTGDALGAAGREIAESVREVSRSAPGTEAAGSGGTATPGLGPATSDGETPPKS